MFSYFLSVAVAFIVFGVIFNIVKKVDPYWYDIDDEEVGWFIIFVASLIWFVAIPLIGVFMILFVLKLLTDNIAETVMNRIEKRKSQSKLEK